MKQLISFSFLIFCICTGIYAQEKEPISIQHRFWKKDLYFVGDKEATQGMFLAELGKDPTNLKKYQSARTFDAISYVGTAFVLASFLIEDDTPETFDINWTWWGAGVAWSSIFGYVASSKRKNAIEDYNAGVYTSFRPTSNGVGFVITF